jgi:hypothetical protein
MTTINTNQIILPSNPADLKAIKSEVNACVDAMTRIAAEKDFISETVSALAEKYELPKSTLNKMVRVHFKRNMEEVVAQAEELETAYETVMNVK